MTQPGAYTFVPWFRQGVAAGIEQVDDLASTATGRASIEAELTLAATPLQGANPIRSLIAQTVQLVSPGDVASFKTEAILRVYPPADARDATPGELAYIEFYEEDLPWRYTPARPAMVEVAGEPRPQLRPWLALFVLAQGEFEVHVRTGGQPALTVAPGAALPPPDEAWAWAHAQLAGTTAGAGTAGSDVAKNPDAALSRLMSPRRLVPGTQYAAFLVPAFETGRLAGLGRKTDGVARMKPSWTPGGTDLMFPVYYAWQFTTGTDGSFESYVRRLTAFPVGDAFGKREVAADLSGYPVTETGPVAVADPVTFELEGALRPPEFESDRDGFVDAPTDPLAGALNTMLDLSVSRLEAGGTTGDDPGVVPPVYGRWPAGVARLAAVGPGDDVAWIRELNLDLRERASAGLGAQIVRDHQDDLMNRAWAQVGSLHDVNQQLREAELAVAASSALFHKHIAPVAADELFLLSTATHHGLAAEAVVATPPPAATATTASEPVPSLRGAVETSAIPTAAQDAAFKRATRPATPLMRRATGTKVVGAFRADLIANLNDGKVTAAPPVPPPAASVSLADISGAVAAAQTTGAPKAEEPKRVFWQMLVLALTPPPPPPPPALPPPPPPLPGPAGLGTAAMAQFTAWQTSHTVDTATVTAVNRMITNIKQVIGEPDGTVTVVIPEDLFQDNFGKEIASKSGEGVTVKCENTTLTKTARFADNDAAATYGGTLATMDTDVDARIAAVPVPPELAGLTGLTTGLHAALRPADTLVARVTSALPGFLEAAAERAAARTRRLQPVMAYPTFPEPMVTALQAIDREHVLPNMGDLPADSLTLMAPNGRFIEAFFAGLNTQMARELLWQEYPTDQRGSYFRSFWSRDDAVGSTASDDIAELPGWTGALGTHGSAAASPLVLVIRSELLRKFPNTLVYAQPAKFLDAQGTRTLDTNAPPKYPSFHATLDPDVTLAGFDIPEKQARGRPPGTNGPADAGDPGMFFVLAERPGQLRFGLDATAPAGGLKTWDDLSWPAVTGSTDYLRVTGNAPAPSQDPPGVWGATAADMAVILFRSPVMYARHASTMLPQPPTQEPT